MKVNQGHFHDGSSSFFFFGEAQPEVLWNICHSHYNFNKTGIFFFTPSSFFSSSSLSSHLEYMNIKRSKKTFIKQLLHLWGCKIAHVSIENILKQQVFSWWVSVLARVSINELKFFFHKSQNERSFRNDYYFQIDRLSFDSVIKTNSLLRIYSWIIQVGCKCKAVCCFDNQSLSYRIKYLHLPLISVLHRRPDKKTTFRYNMQIHTRIQLNVTNTSDEKLLLFLCPRSKITFKHGIHSPFK